MYKPRIECYIFNIMSATLEVLNEQVKQLEAKQRTPEEDSQLESLREQLRSLREVRYSSSKLITDVVSYGTKPING